MQWVKNNTGDPEIKKQYLCALRNNKGEYWYQVLEFFGVVSGEFMWWTTSGVVRYDNVVYWAEITAPKSAGCND